MKTYIIAEAGVNHNGDFAMAEKMIDAAAEAGADCIKFQTFIAGEVISKRAEKASYQKAATGDGETQYEMVKKLELSFDQFRELAAYCAKKNIDFLSTPFDHPSIDFLDEMNIPFWKIPSGELTNLPYLMAIARTKRPVVMSTGMSNIAEIEEAVNVLRENGTPEITLLHCNTEYPTPYADVNLRAMLTLRDHFKCAVGYSDHTVGITVPVAAAAMGAVIIEKHFTLDNTLPGPDHKASLEPQELSAMVAGIRTVEEALGEPDKKPSPSETKNIAIARKSITARRDIKEGEVYSEENITAKRPGTGVSPMRWFEVLGRTAARDFQQDELIEL